MCEFASWVEKGDKIHFLTKSQMNSPQGEVLKKRFTGSGELVGHAAIRAYYDICDGKDKECTDFSTPDNFPEVIVKAIKNNEMDCFDFPMGLLTQDAYDKARADYDKAWDAYDKAWDAYDKARDAYDKARDAFGKAYTSELEQLHKELCPDCPWDGKSIFTRRG